MGDFNDKCNSWDDDHCTSELGRKLYDLAKVNTYNQLINEPTRTSGPVLFAIRKTTFIYENDILKSGFLRQRADPSADLDRWCTHRMHLLYGSTLLSLLLTCSRIQIHSQTLLLLATKGRSWIILNEVFSSCPDEWAHGLNMWCVY